MAVNRLPDLSPWRRQALKIPPDSLDAWIRLAVWELWMGTLLYGALSFGVQLIATAPNNIITVFDLKNCYTVPVVLPCERIAYRAGALNVAFNIWCGVLLLAFAVWLVCELWSAVAPKPITDDFLKLLDDSFGRDWRRPRSWPWARLVWAYGFTVAGIVLAPFMLLLASAALTRAMPTMAAKPPAAHVDTSQRFRTQ